MSRTKTWPVTCVLAAMLFASACTSQQLYDGAAPLRLGACAEFEEPQRSECLSQADTPHRDYERERRRSSGTD